MKRVLKPITPEMIRACFGPRAEVSKFLGRYKVTTQDGGVLKIWQREIRTVHTSRDAYAGCARLVGAAWGGGKVKGPPDFMLASLAYGEAEGVNVRVRERGTAARGIVAALIVVIGSNLLDNSYHGPLISGVIAVLVWLLMKRAAKLQAERETEQMSFPFPRTGGDAKEPSDEDLKQGGWM